MFDRLRIVPKAVIALSAPFAALLGVGLAPFLAPATGGSPGWVSGVALAGLLAGLAAVFLAVRGVRRSLAQAVAAVDAVSTGDLETAVPAYPTAGNICHLSCWSVKPLPPTSSLTRQSATAISALDYSRMN